MKTVSGIRNSFLSYFEAHNHTVVPSSPLVPQNDPTLMFVNAGMVPFKDVFIGQETKTYTRAASSQKCVRAGGKHNDLENVGHTARHHTFFEMLGNFSFGDYFKEQAIELAWNLITKEYQIPKERLIITVYSQDEEAYQLWNKITGLGSDKILKIPTADNFWSMGETGPCGPCSEIFYDHGEHIPGGLPGTPEEDGDRFVEIWNLVFMQYMVQEAGGAQLPLPKPSIDTGMGLERISAVLQGVHDNYDIDLFKNIIAESEHIIGEQAHTPEQKVSHRVIADHVRSSCFMMADGVMPSNEGRGYVLRRIMRRAMRHAHLLGSKDPHMHRLVPVLIKEMGDAYPELGRAKSLLEDSLKREETRFKETLGRGLRLLNDETAKLSSGAALPGDVAFKLYDTFGFPLDLTQDVLKSENRGVDIQGFESAMAEQKKAAKAAWSGSGDVKQEKIWFDVKDTHGANEFLGYQTTQAEGVVLAIVKDGQQIQTAQQGDLVHILTNQTPFYGESGGQMGDSGQITTQQACVNVETTHLKLRDMHVVSGVVEKGSLSVGESVDQSVNVERRDRIRANHSATHLLHAALRQTLGDSLVQKGSLVAPERLRFDFSHNTAVTREQINQVEQTVNARIRLNDKVETRLMHSDEAQAAGAMALFGEKYADEVRVVSMGGHQDNSDKNYSLELCGGTHVRQTGDIGFFKIISESGIAAGIRRIEALTGNDALVYCQRLESLTDATANLLKTSTEKLNDKVSHLLDERKKLEKDIKNLQKKLASGGSEGTSKMDVQDINGVKFIHRDLQDVSARDVKPIVDQLKQKLGSGIVLVTATQDGKVTVVVGVTSDLTGSYSAVDLVRKAAEIVGGKGGGGRPDMAQAGGTLPDKTSEAAKALVNFLAN